ncbi:MAG: DUF3795 domain-containing protein [Candidatus Edwardsbacteria bacterium]|nr:DUF3795 domain-containing protein [Candidatus Edwardsbacteria bacterium]
MNKKISFCGLDCTACPAYIARYADDPELRRKTAATWSQIYGADIKPEDIFCDGCTSEGTLLFGHCRVCQIRECGRAKELESCAHCPEYACVRLNEFFGMVPEARQVLDDIRKTLK